MKVEDSKKNNQNTTNNQSQKQIISDIPIFLCPFCKAKKPKIINIKKKLKYKFNLYYSFMSMYN